MTISASAGTSRCAGLALDRLDHRVADQAEPDVSIQRLAARYGRGELIARVAAQEYSHGQLFAALGALRQPPGSNRLARRRRWQVLSLRPAAAGRGSSGGAPESSAETIWAALIQEWDSASPWSQYGQLGQVDVAAAADDLLAGRAAHGLGPEPLTSGGLGRSFESSEPARGAAARRAASLRSASWASVSTPSTRAARASLASKLATTGSGQPRTFWNTRAGPPSSAAERAIWANSPRGSTSAVMSFNPP